MYLYLIIGIRRLISLIRWLLTRESLGFGRHLAIWKRKDQIVAPQAVKHRGVLLDESLGQLALEFYQL